MTLKIRILIIFLAISALLYCYGRFVEPYRITVTKLNLQIEGYFRSSGKVRAILLSDLHIKDFGQREENVLQKVSDLKPDIIFITGDFIQTRANPEGAAKFVSHLMAPLGIWGIIGNIDTTAPDKIELITMLESAGLNMLDNELRRIEKDGLEFDLIGLSLNPEMETINTLFRKGGNGIPKIVLIHWPRLVGKVIRYHPQLILCGHTHGGQIRLPLIGRYLARLISNTHYDMGLFRISSTWLYVSRGIGMTSHPIRLFCPPEITLLTLEFILQPFK